MPFLAVFSALPRLIRSHRPSLKSDIITIGFAVFDSTWSPFPFGSILL